MDLYRCIHVADAYTSLGRYAETLGLFDLAFNYISQARASLQQITPQNDDGLINITEKELQETEQTIRGRKCKAHAAWYLEQGEQTEDASRKLEDMDLDEVDEVKLRGKQKSVFLKIGLCTKLSTIHYLL